MRPWVRLGLAALGCWCQAGAATRKNLVANGGFERGLASWQADPKYAVATGDAAHSGKACLTGEVTHASKFMRLTQAIPIRTGNLYSFEIWARATHGTKLVLWARRPGSKTRTMIAAWKRVPRTWRRYHVPINPSGNGKLTLEIIAPSSMGEPPGRMWIDDVALYETPLPPPTSIAQDEGFNDNPSLVQASDGSVYGSWLSFRDGADSLQFARYELRDGGLLPAGRWQALGGPGTFVLNPTLIANGDGAVLTYATEIDGNWDVFAVSCGADGPGEPVRITSHNAVDVKPKAAWFKGTLWVAWESNRNGCRQVLYTSVAMGKPGKLETVSPLGASSYLPAVAVLDSGEVCVAWHSFRKNNVDVFLRRRSASGVWGQERRLTQAPAIDRNAVLVAHGDELWLVYEHAQMHRYHVGTTNRRRLMVARVTPDGLEAPEKLRRSPLSGRCEAGTPAFDKTGRLWIAFLRPRLPRAGWDAFLTAYTGTQWLPPRVLAAQKGMDRQPGLVVAGDRALVAFAVDDAPPSWRHVDRPPLPHGNILAASVDISSAPPAARMHTETLVESDEPFEAAAIRIARGEDTPTPSIHYNGQTLKLFYGDLHEHSEISVCNRCGDQALDESYQCLRDIARHDFLCITDHGYNHTPYLWNLSAKMARANDDPGLFVPFLGQEWTSSFEKYSDKHPYGYYGHRNLILADLRFPRWWNANNGETPADIWAALRKMKANFVHIPHQLADTGNVPTDWTFVDETAQPVAEIFQTRGSYEHAGAPRQAKRTAEKGGYFLQDAWARGIVIGVIASPDHGGGYGKAAVFAPELTREAILDALRARRCYGTTAAKILLDVRVNGHLMGERIAAKAGDPVRLAIRVLCPADISSVEVCRNNKFIYRNEPEGRSAELTFVDDGALPGRSYYYVRVIQKDEEIAWSSPVWVDAR